MSSLCLPSSTLSSNRSGIQRSAGPLMDSRKHRPRGDHLASAVTIQAGYVERHPSLPHQRTSDLLLCSHPSVYGNQWSGYV